MVETALAFAVYTVLAEASYLFVFTPGTNALFWLPSGFTLALLLRTKRERWPVWLAVIFVAELAQVFRHGQPAALAVSWALANALFPLTSASLLCHISGAPFGLRNVREVALLAFGAAAGAVPGALVAAAAANAWLGAPLPTTVASWWSSDALGALLVAPLVLTSLSEEPRPPGGALEAAILTIVLVLGTWTVFGAEAPPGAIVATLPYVLLPVVAWAAVRFGKRGAAMATVILDCLAVAYTARGRGPFASLHATEAASLLDLQVYVAVMGLFSLMLATAVVEEREARAAAQAAERRSAFLAEATALMASSLDYDERLRALARLCVRSLAEWCVVDVVEGGEIRRVGSAHADPSKEELVRELQRRYAPAWRSAQPGGHAVRRGEPLLIPEVTDSILEGYAVDEGHARLVAELGTATAMAVPLVVRGTPIGAITLASGRRGRRYGPADLALAQELAGRAAAAIDNARLYRDAQEAIRLRDEFLSVASHELNTPITSLQLSVQSIEQGIAASPDALRRSLALVGRQTRKLARLVEELLGVSRIVAGRLHLEREELDLAAVVRDVAARMEEELTRAACPIVLSAEQEVSGRWDRLRLEQVVQNLLSNALKFGAGKPIEIEIGQTNGTATLVIRDHGIGISADRLEDIFQRFERGVSARSYGGLGLGLYVARSIVEAHGGTIRADTAPGDGARFVVALPRTPPSADAVPRSAA